MSSVSSQFQLVTPSLGGASMWPARHLEAKEVEKEEKEKEAPGALLLQEAHLLEGQQQPGVHGAEHPPVVLPHQLGRVPHKEAAQAVRVDVRPGHPDSQQLVVAGQGGLLPAGGQGAA